MNKPNNKRKKLSQTKIEKSFIELLQKKEINEISVTEICKITGINRSTFYANYIDIFDLIDKIKDSMINDFFQIYKEEIKNKYHSYDFLKLFYHIKDNQLFYKTYFKLNLDLNNHIGLVDENEAIKIYGSNNNIEYHIEFFKAGLNAIIKKWLKNNCKEKPEEILEIIEKEYGIEKIKILSNKNY